MKRFRPLKFGLATAICAAFAAFGFGQTLDADDLLNPSPDLSEWTASGKNSSVFITQTGNLNEAQINQSLMSPSGAGQTNLIRVLQSGEGNFSQITLKGQNNRTDLFQNGNQNALYSNVMGSNNASRFLQMGDRNTIIQTLVGANSINTEFIQNGSDNRIEEEIRGYSQMGVRLVQNGNGLNAVVRQINTQVPAQ